MIRITYTLGSRGTAALSSSDFKRDTATAFRFDTDDPISILNETSTATLFNGNVLTVRDRPIMLPNVGTESAIDATDKTRYFDNRIITPITFSSGTPMRDVVDYIVVYLSWLGVTRDLGMLSGPALDGFTIDHATATEALNELSRVTGYPWRLTPSLVLQMAVPGTWTAAFSLTSTNGKIWDGLPSWVKSKKQKINRVYVKYGGERQVPKGPQTFTATAGQTVFTLEYPAAGTNLRGYILVNGQHWPLGTAPWSWDIGSNSIIHASGATVGTTVTVEGYEAQFPLVAIAENASAATEPLESRHEYPNVFDKDEAQQIAAGLLARYEAAPRVVTVKTRAGFEMPGTMVTISVPERGISSSSWLIQSVNIKTDKDQKFTYEYTCAEGTQAVDSWVDSFRSLIGSGRNGSSTGNVSGSLLPLPSGVFSTPVIANSGANVTGNRESRLANWANASLEGAALVLGAFNSTYAWAIVADHLAVGPNVRRIRWVPVQESGAERFAMQLSQDPGTPVDGEYYVTANGPTSVLTIGAPSSSGFGLNHRARGYFSDFDASNGLSERGRTVKLGEWTAVAYNAANFTASSGTWTVDSGDQVTYAYAIVGKAITVSFTIVGTDVSATPAELRIAIPGGFTAARRMDSAVWLVNAGTREVGQAIVDAAGTYIRFLRSAAGNFSTTAADDTTVAGQITFEVS